MRRPANFTPYEENRRELGGTLTRECFGLTPYAKELVRTLAELGEFAEALARGGEAT